MHTYVAGYQVLMMLLRPPASTWLAVGFFAMIGLLGLVHGTPEFGVNTSQHRHSDRGDAGQVRGRRVLLYTTLGSYSPEYHDMLNMMLSTFHTHVCKRARVVLIAHESWREPLRDLRSPYYVIALKNQSYAPDIPLRDQAAAHKLLIFDLFRATLQYDLVVLLDVDIIVTNNFLRRVGDVPADTLLVKQEGSFDAVPWRVREWNASELEAFHSRGLLPFNTGQLVFRPSEAIRDLFREAHRLWKQTWKRSVYEQGALNDAFLTKGRLSYVLNNVTLVGRSKIEALPERILVRYGILHFAGTTFNATAKGLRMKQVYNWAMHLPTNASRCRVQGTVQPGGHSSERPTVEQPKRHKASVDHPTGSDSGTKAQRVLLYTSLGSYSPEYHDMLSMMLSTFHTHVCKRARVVLIAHESWREPLRDLRSPYYVFALKNQSYAPDIPLRDQAAAHKLLIFDLFRATLQYDLVVLLDVDIIVTNNFLRRVGDVPADTLLVKQEGSFDAVPWRVREWNASELEAFHSRGLLPFNTGQLVFRPSEAIRDLFREAHRLWKQTWKRSVYEQGALNDAFLTKGRLSYVLNNVTLVGRSKIEALPERILVRYGILHFAGTTFNATAKGLRMKQVYNWAMHLPTNALRCLAR